MLENEQFLTNFDSLIRNTVGKTDLLNTDELPVHGPGGETAKLKVGGLSTVVEGCGVSENLFFLDPPLLKIVFFPGFLLAFQGFWGIKILLRDAFDFIIFFP